MSGRVIRFPLHALSSEQAQTAARRVFETPIEERVRRKRALHLEDPETLLAICALLRQRIDTDPAGARAEAEFFFHFIESPKRDIGLFDERKYFLGELALLAGAACRHLSRREEAWLWFDRSESGFRHTVNAAADLSRLAYQRLAERMEERQIEAVLELLPDLEESFRELGMPEDALKARFLEGLALIETDQFPQAVTVFHEICSEAEALGNEKLLATACANLTNIYGMMGMPDEAIESSRRAIPVLQRMNDRIVLAKIQWALAALLREKGHVTAAIEAYRQAQQQFQALEMRADTAALNLIIGDLLLDLGENSEALREIAAALPVIDELKMAPEGMAALSLLRESARRQEVDRSALRELHGYFPQPQA